MTAAVGFVTEKSLEATAGSISLVCQEQRRKEYGRTKSAVRGDLARGTGQENSDVR